MNELLLYETDERSLDNSEKSCWIRPEKSIETCEEVRNRLESIGVEDLDLSGLQERFQNEIANCTEKMYEEFPTIKGYIRTIRSADLPKGVLACSGPRFEGNTYKGAELQFNKNFFKNRHYSLDIVNLESDLNWRGESWLAGKGGEGVIAHEIGHVMALQLNGENVGVEIGESSFEKKCELQNQYIRNFSVIQICTESLKEMDISVNDIGKELSTYGAHDFGEMFAECVSEVQTRKKPRQLAINVVKKYESIVSKKEVEK